MIYRLYFNHGLLIGFHNGLLVASITITGYASLMCFASTESWAAGLPHRPNSLRGCTSFQAIYTWILSDTELCPAPLLPCDPAFKGVRNTRYRIVPCYPASLHLKEYATRDTCSTRTERCGLDLVCSFRSRACVGTEPAARCCTRRCPSCGVESSGRAAGARRPCPCVPPELKRGGVRVLRHNAGLQVRRLWTHCLPLLHFFLSVLKGSFAFRVLRKLFKLMKLCELYNILFYSNGCRCRLISLAPLDPAVLPEAQHVCIVNHAGFDMNWSSEDVRLGKDTQTTDTYPIDQKRCEYITHYTIRPFSKPPLFISCSKWRQTRVFGMRQVLSAKHGSNLD